MTDKTLTTSANVFIPNYFVRFGDQWTKPLGIAYADLPSIEEAERVMHDLDKSIFKDRKLRIRFHVPFTPGPRFPRLGSIKRKTKKNVFNIYPPASADIDNDEIIASAGNTPRPADPLAPSSHLQFSNTVLFVKGMRHKVREEKIMLHFKEFNPMEVIIQKPRGIIKGLKSRACHALVLFDLPLGVTLDKVIADCKTRVFDGGHLTLVRAFALREKLFSLQAPVEGAGLRIDGVVLPHDLPAGETSLATPNADTGCWYSDGEEIEPVEPREKFPGIGEPGNDLPRLEPMPTQIKEGTVSKLEAQSPEQVADRNLETLEVGLDSKLVEVTVAKQDPVSTLKGTGTPAETPAKSDSPSTGTKAATDSTSEAAAQTLGDSGTDEAASGLKLATVEQNPDSPSNVVGEISLTETAVESGQHGHILEKKAEARVEVKPQAVSTLD